MFGFKSCLVPPEPPKPNYYKPLADSITCVRKKMAYYSIIENNKKLNVVIGVGSTKKWKSIRVWANLKNKNNTIIPIEKLDLTSKRIKFNLKKERFKNNSFFKSVYTQNFKMTDQKWYGNMVKGKDTLILHVKPKNQKIIEIPFYFEIENPVPNCLKANFNPNKK